MRLFLSAGLFLLTSVSLSAQGIQFMEGNWAGVLAKAKAEKKLIYLDAYTTWCGPCKMLASNIFPTKQAGDYYNAHFVNYRVDAEKGEGIALAKKYEVNSYPTHLYIDPVSGNLIHRNSGYSPEVSHFVHEGEVAGLEWKDTMTLEKYAARFPEKKNDKAFLQAYLQKMARLGKNNDALLNAYVAQLNGKASDADILFLGEQIGTLDNEAVALVSGRPEVFAKAFPDQRNYLREMNARWAGGTYQKAVSTRNEALLDKMAIALKQTNLDMWEDEMYYWRNRFYQETRNGEGAMRTALQEAEFLLQKAPAVYARQDAAAIVGIQEQMKAQLTQMNIPQAQWEEMIRKNMEAQPGLLHSATLQAAQKLNSTAWIIYQNKAGDPALVQSALRWSKKSLELAAMAPEQWAVFANTYAHLLYRSGDKAGATAMQQEVVDKLRTAGRPELATFQASLDKMKNGTL